MCGHFLEGVQVFERRSIRGETRGQWYLRQMMGSANISGSKAMHFMTGNLSHQIEHHLFPDLPSNRYAEVAVKVRALFEKYELEYVTGPLPKQVFSAWHKVFRLAPPKKKPKVKKVGPRAGAHCRLIPGVGSGLPGRTGGIARFGEMRCGRWAAAPSDRTAQDPGRPARPTCG
ncbi:hypothetical protein SMICM304S_09083 [Streptomyces microflavus]